MMHSKKEQKFIEEHIYQLISGHPFSNKVKNERNVTDCVVQTTFRQTFAFS